MVPFASLFLTLGCSRPPAFRFRKRQTTEADNEGNTAIILASGAGSLDCVGFLLSHGANPNDENTLGYTPLVMACIAADLEVVQLLIEHGAR